MEQNYWLENLLREGGFIPKCHALNIVDGTANRKGIHIETSISFHQEIKNYTATGHGAGEYDTLEEVRIAIMIPKTRGGVRENSGRKKVGGGQVKRSVWFTGDEQRKLQFAIDHRAVSFNAFVRRAALNAASENRNEIIENKQPKKNRGGKSLSLSFSTDERNNLQVVADRHSMSFSSYVKNAALKAASDLQLDNVLLS